MRELIDFGNLRISWNSYTNPNRFFCYRRYLIHNQNGDDHFLFIGPLQFRWWTMKDYSRMINRSDYFKAMEIYHQTIMSLNLQNPPNFREFMPSLPLSDPSPTPFRATVDTLLLELTPEGYRHYEMLSNKHAKTLLAVWIIQHENQPR